MSEAACARCPGLARCGAPVPGRRTVGVYDRGSGFVELAHVPCGPARERDTAAAEQARAAELLRSSRLPPGTEHMTLESYRPSLHTADAYARACELARRPAAGIGGGPARGLVLAGPVGVGKTHVAVGVLRAWLAAGRHGIFSCVPDLLDDLRRAARRGDDGGEALELLRRAELLVLDDLGAERPTEWAVERLFLLVNGRELDRTVLIVTTNSRTPAELAVRVGDRIVSRVLGMCDWVAMDGPDYRALRGETGGR